MVAKLNARRMTMTLPVLDAALRVVSWSLALKGGDSPRSAHRAAGYAGILRNWFDLATMARSC